MGHVGSMTREPKSRDEVFNAPRFAERYVQEMRDNARAENECWQQLDDWIDTEPAKAWEVLVELGKLASAFETGRIGGGPLEEFLIKNQSYAEKAVALASANESFRSMLECVRTTDLGPEARSTIRRVLDT
jgi:hypothetical protein